MAEITVQLTAIDGKMITVNNPLSLTLASETAAACDSLSLRFTAEAPLPELITATVLHAGVKIFFGYLDMQRETANGNSITADVYARSSACVLVDNEAEPFTYLSPSAEALYVLHARPFGFENRLPALYCEADYAVEKGTSCYGAVNRFVYGISGKSIRISPEGALYLPDGKGSLPLDKKDILREIRTVSRGGVCHRIDYKTEGDRQYRHHIKSRRLERLGIQSSKKLNLASLPAWQRAFTLKRQLYDAAREYRKAELLVSGAIFSELYTPVTYLSPVFGSIDGYYVDGVRITLDGNGWRTQFTLLKQQEWEEINYVA